MKQDNELPLGWCLTTLGNIAVWSSGGTPKTTNKEYYGGDIPWLIIGDLNDGYIYESKNTITEQGLKNSSAKIAEPDSVLLAMYGSIGKLGINKIPVATNQAIAFTKEIYKSTCNKYLFYYLLSIRSDLFFLGKGGTQLNISQTVIKSVPLPLPPINEQHRIVTEIEKQFSRLDETVSALKRIQANLKRYKASVLKSAVEGKLTSAWREQNPALESAQQLLERILKERRAHWEAAELAKMQANGKPPKDNQWKLKYKEPVNPDITLLPELPAGWMWARLDTISSIKGGITIDRNKTASDFKSVPYLRVANVQRGYLDLSKIKEILAPEHKIKGLLLQNNDILFNEGGDLDKLGRGWIWEGQINNCIHQNHVFRARLFLPSIQAKIISWWGNSFGRNYFLIAGNQTTNLASINLTVLSGFPVPLPPLNEQAQIVAEVEKRLSVAEEVEQQINRNLKRAEHLRQAILKRAFSGKLVPQNPADEPASVLLEKLNQTSTKKP
jgi:type I restriction enzyme S subunit